MWNNSCCGTMKKGKLRSFLKVFFFQTSLTFLSLSHITFPHPPFFLSFWRVISAIIPNYPFMEHPTQWRNVVRIFLLLLLLSFYPCPENKVMNCRWSWPRCWNTLPSRCLLNLIFSDVFSRAIKRAHTGDLSTTGSTFLNLFSSSLWRTSGTHSKPV